MLLPMPPGSMAGPMSTHTVSSGATTAHTCKHLVTCLAQAGRCVPQRSGDPTLVAEAQLCCSSAAAALHLLLQSDHHHSGAIVRQFASAVFLPLLSVRWALPCHAMAVEIAQGLVDVAVAQSAAPFMQDLIKAVAAGLPPGHPRAPSLSLPPAAHVYALPGDVAIMLASCILHRCGTPIVCTVAGREVTQQAPVSIVREAVRSLLPLALQMSMAPDAATRAASSKALLPALLSAVHSACATAGKQR
ncbi:MAG: hypothetical protein WDW38_003954 [Sanguina aurantia]